MTDKLAELFGEEEAKAAKAAARAPDAAARDDRRGGRTPAGAAGRTVKKTSFQEAAKAQRAAR
jgi:hypothetical protein